MSETDRGRQALWRGGGHAPSPSCVSWEQKLEGVVRREWSGEGLCEMVTLN